MPARWMLYSHDALGLGHVRRMLAIARAVLECRLDLSTLLVTCSPQVDALPIPHGLDYVKLPSARKAGPGDYRPRTLRVDSACFRALRSELLRAIASAFMPDLVLVDKSPLGLMGELSATLPILRSGTGKRLIVGWRDILDEPGQVQGEWQRQGTMAVLDRSYDEIWVYGDARVFDVRRAYGLSDRIADRVHHLGYLAPRVPAEDCARMRAWASPDDEPFAVVTVGGGEEGEALLACFLQALQQERPLRGLRTVMVTGPFMPAEARQRLQAQAGTRARVVPFVPGLEAVIACADVVVGRAGYNTVCEALGSGTPSVLVPRVLHREEQRIRARRLAELDLCEVVEEEALNPRRLAEATRRALARGRRRPEGVSLDGLAVVARRVERLLPRESVAISAA